MHPQSSEEPLQLHRNFWAGGTFSEGQLSFFNNFLLGSVTPKS